MKYIHTAACSAENLMAINLNGGRSLWQSQHIECKFSCSTDLYRLNAAVQRSGRAEEWGRGTARSPICPQTFIYNISVVSAQNLQSLTPTALATKLMWAKMLNNLEWVLGIDNRVTRKAVRRIAFILACRIPQFIMMRGRIWLATEACPRPNEVIKYTPPFLLPGLVRKRILSSPFCLLLFLIEHNKTYQHGF